MLHAAFFFQAVTKGNMNSDQGMQLYTSACDLTQQLNFNSLSIWTSVAEHFLPFFAKSMGYV